MDQELMLRLLPSLVTAAAVVVAVAAYVRSGQLACDAAASAIWRDYEKFAFDNAEFTMPMHDKLDCSKQTYDGDPMKFAKYQWFVSYTLLACEEVLASSKTGSDWTKSVFRQLKIHRTFLLSEHFAQKGFIEMLSPQIRSHIGQLNQLQGVL